METFWARNQNSFAIVKPDIYKILIKRWIFDDSDKIEIRLPCFWTVLTFRNISGDFLTKRLLIYEF